MTHNPELLLEDEVHTPRSDKKVEKPHVKFFLKHEKIGHESFSCLSDSKK